jgi:hypothetical protein
MQGEGVIMAHETGIEEMTNKEFWWLSPLDSLDIWVSFLMWATLNSQFQVLKEYFGK